MTLSDTDQENEAEVLTVLESVDKLCEKSKEAKTTGNDQMRAKNAGKATKKEYPTFDINPKIAQEYLVRARKSKDGEPVAKDRPLYVAEESQEALEFQTQGEEYTRWKDVPLEDAKPEKQDEKPATWADAARKKANAANGLGGKAESTKVPAKPKLVSKTPSNEASPWKIQRNAPKISPTEVPAKLRSLMSYALWRIHESIHRNESNQLFLLTDDETVRKVALKLNIPPRSMKDVRQVVKDKTPKSNLEILGDLEKDGLVEPEGTAGHRANMRRGSPPSSSCPIPVIDNEESEAKPQILPNPPAPSAIFQETANGGTPSGDAEAHEKPLTLDKSSGEDQKEENISQSEEQPQEEFSEERKLKDNPTVRSLNPKDLVRDLLKPVASGVSRISDQKIEGEDVHAGPTPNSKLSIIHDIEQHMNRLEAKEATDTAKKGSNLRPQTPPRVVDDIGEDSDEEVVVFVPNPKRMSAQKKSLPLQPKPSILSGDIATNINVRQADSTGLKPQREAGLKPAFQPQRQSRPSSKGSVRPSSSGPTVIDPDAFGRGFAVNPDSNNRAHTRSAKPKSARHSPQPSLQHDRSSSALNGSAAPFQPNSSPQSQSLNRSPRRSPRAFEQPREAGDDAEPATVPTISHQAFTRSPLVLSNNPDAKQSRFGPIAPPSKADKEAAANFHTNAGSDSGLTPPSLPQNASIQRPRSAHGSPNPSASQKVQHSPVRANLGKRDMEPSPKNRRQRTSRATLFEPEIDATRAFSPSVQTSHSESNLQDVQYVLKSGTTREASRGKGKLWTG